NCLTYLSDLRCSSDICSEFFHQLSQICCNLQSLFISFEDEEASNGLKELVVSQNNLKSLGLSVDIWPNNIIPALTKLSNTLTTLRLFVDYDYLSLSFVSSFSNLQTIILSHWYNCDSFKELQYVVF